MRRKHSRPQHEKTPHMGHAPPAQVTPVRVISSSREAKIASSKTFQKSPNLNMRMQSLYWSFISRYCCIIGVTGILASLVMTLCLSNFNMTTKRSCCAFVLNINGIRIHRHGRHFDGEQVSPVIAKLITSRYFTSASN